MKSQMVDHGFVRTIDIHLTLSRIKTALDNEDLNFLKEDFLVRLNEQSSNMMPFRCFINSAE